MRAKFKSKSSIPALALALAMAAIAVGSAASPAAASPVAPAVNADGEYRPSEYRPSIWVEGGGVSGETTSLTSDAAEPGSGTGSQLPIGLGLFGLALVALVVAMASLRRASRPRLDPYANRIAGSSGPPAETGATY